jgi:transcriptional regulator GlxA family with amidase domain
MAAIILYEGVSSFEAFGALAALRAGGRPARLIGTEALVPTLEGPRVVPDKLGYDGLEHEDAVIVPGGDVKRPLADAALAKALRSRRGHYVLASGESIRILAAAGLCEGRRVARMPGESEIPGAVEVHARLVADARLLTSFAGDALIDLVIHWIEHEDGAKAGERAAHRLGREYRPFALGEQA